LALGTLFKSDEALRIGLIDEIAVDKAEAIAKSETFLLKFQNIPPQARTAAKMYIRGKDIQKLITNRQADSDLFVSVISEKKIQKQLGLFVAVLKARKIFKTLTKPFTTIMKMFGGKSKIKKSKKYFNAFY
jgi:Delta3-Delta2-enoyl-CoA isomerase